MDKTIILSSIVAKPQRRKSPIKCVVTQESRWQHAEITGNDRELVTSMLQPATAAPMTPIQRLAWSQIQQKLYNYREQDAVKQAKATAQDVEGLPATAAEYTT